MWGGGRSGEETKPRIEKHRKEMASTWRMPEKEQGAGEKVEGEESEKKQREEKEEENGNQVV